MSGDPRREQTPLEKMLAAGSNRYVSWLLDQGKLTSEVRKALRGLFPGSAPNTIEAAIRAGRTAHTAGEQMQVASDPEYRLPAGDVPRTGTGRNMWCYWVTLEIQTADGQRAHRTVAAELGSSGTNAQVIAAAEQALEDAQASPFRRPGSDPLAQGWDVTGVIYHAVERC